jgi:pilus assembly protein TadC
MRQRRRQARLIGRDYPDFVDVLVLTVRAGCTPFQAFEIVPDAVSPLIGEALRRVVRSVADGERFADALIELPKRLGGIAQPLADALSLCDRYGAPLAPILDRLADEARAQRRRNADIAARQLPIRLSFPLVLLTLPSFVLLTIVPLMAGTISSLHGLRR